MAQNVLGTELQPCSIEPPAGVQRDGCCSTDGPDATVQVVCAQMTDAFLDFCASVGDDLAAPDPDRGVAGLHAGDRWCVGASRWLEANEAGVAPPVVLEATHMAMLEFADRAELEANAVEREGD